MEKGRKFNHVFVRHRVHSRTRHTDSHIIYHANDVGYRRIHCTNTSASRAPGASAAPIGTSRGRVHAMAASASTRLVALHGRLRRRVAATSPMAAAALNVELGMFVEAAARLEARVATMQCEEVLHDARSILTASVCPHSHAT